MKLLFINSLKGLRNKKIQMIGIILMIFLSTAIFSAMNLSINSIENKYNNYVKEQKVEDFSFVPNINFFADYSLSEIQILEEEKLNNISENEKLLLLKYKQCLTHLEDSCTDEIFLNSLYYIFNNYNALEKKIDEKLVTIKRKENFIYEKQVAKITNDNKFLYKFIPYNKEAKINVPFLVKGEYPKNNNEITVLETFFNNNNLKLGQIYTINEVEYKIVGIMYASDHLYPLLSINIPLFDQKYHTIIFTNYDTFELVKAHKDSSYVGRFNDRKNVKNQFDSLFNISKDRKENVKLLGKKDDFMGLDMFDFIRKIRIETINIQIKNDRLFSKYFLYLLLSISAVIITIITKKRIEDERLQIGVLKSLGYKASSIAVSYLVYPIMGSIVGGTLGFGLGTALYPILANVYKGYYSMPIPKLIFDSKYLLISVLLPLVTLSILSYFISKFMLRKKPLELLKEGSNLKVNFISKITNKILSKFTFKTRFKYSLASRSFGKLAIISITSFFTGMLIVLTLIGMNLFSSVIDKGFNNLNYKYVVNYDVPQSDLSKDDDHIIDLSMNIVKVISKENKEKKVPKEDNSIFITGIDKNIKLIDIKDSKDKNLINSLQDESSIIINESIKEIYNIDIGDTVSLDYNKKNIDYKVVAVEDSYLTNEAYVLRESLSKELGYLESIYNKKYTNNKKYKNLNKLSEEEVKYISNIFSVEDLKRNMETQIESFNYSIYFVIAFAFVMALIIISVIANIVVEENNKTISLMKVIGYKDKDISKIVLNIYTPFIIVSYLLSIPVTIRLLKWIIKQLASDINMTIPISISFEKAMFGLGGLLIIYYIAISLSRRVLNKISLAEVLKRE